MIDTRRGGEDPAPSPPLATHVERKRIAAESRKARINVLMNIAQGQEHLPYFRRLELGLNP